jgi:hypothetical protein
MPYMWVPHVNVEEKNKNQAMRRDQEFTPGDTTDYASEPL